MFPTYMLFGMSYDQYWLGDPRLVIYYRKLHWLEIERKNQELWLQGLYFYNAVSTSLANSLSKSKAKYMDKPLDIVPKTEKQLKIEAEREREKAVKELTAWFNRFNANSQE